MRKSKYNNTPLGVFDSGLGGLTVVRELIRQMPHEDIVYFGDTARVPYGTKSKESVVRFSVQNARFLMEHNVKVIVVACNTSSSLALGVLKRGFPVPVVSVIAPGAKKAAVATRNKRVGVIATVGTVKSRAYARAVRRVDSSVRVFAKACPLFVPLVEEGWVVRDITRRIAQEYLRDLKRQKVDTLILGCTHYPLLKGVIQKVMGPGVVLIDSARATAAEVLALLKGKGLEHAPAGKGHYSFWVSDEPKHFRQMAGRFLGFDISRVNRSHV